jgi:hypothetical protein
MSLPRSIVISKTMYNDTKYLLVAIYNFWNKLECFFLTDIAAQDNCHVENYVQSYKIFICGYLQLLQ